VRAANEGLLSASDAEGRVIAQKHSAASGMTVLIASLPPGPGSTLYGQIGDAFAWCIVIIFLGIGARCMWPRKRSTIPQRLDEFSASFKAVSRSD
jgi:apolipoprotein N-acyltransferase